MTDNEQMLAELGAALGRMMSLHQQMADVEQRVLSAQMRVAASQRPGHFDQPDALSEMRDAASDHAALARLHADAWEHVLEQGQRCIALGLEQHRAKREPAPTGHEGADRG